jgi:hypothetical protein
MSKDTKYQLGDIILRRFKHPLDRTNLIEVWEIKRIAYFYSQFEIKYSEYFYRILYSELLTWEKDISIFNEYVSLVDNNYLGQFTKLDGDNWKTLYGQV